MKELLKMIFRCPDTREKGKIKRIEVLLKHYFYMYMVLFVVPINYISSFINNINDMAYIFRLTLVYSITVLLATVFLKFAELKFFFKNKTR